MTQPVLDPLRHRRADGSAGSAPTGVWVDSGRLDQGWPAPRRIGSLPRWVLVTVPLAVAIALVAAVAALGGFDRRGDRIVRVPPDSVITSGPFRLTFGVGVASPGENYDDEKVWKVSVDGTVQVTDPKGDRIDVGESAFVAANVPPGLALVDVDQVAVGTRIGRDYSAGQVTPGLEPVPIRWMFELPEATPPTALLRLVIWQQEFGDITLTQTGEQSWHQTKDGSEILIPITVVSAPS